MRRVIWLLLLGAVVAGCAVQQLNQGLGGLMGQNIHKAVDILGYPDGQQEILGDTVYTWSTNRSAVMPMTTTSSTTSMVGNTPVRGTTTSMTFVPVAYQCIIQIATDKDGTIKRFKLEGNQGGCQRYASRFH